MSLLLEALKKAERAKEEAQQKGAESAAQSTPLSLQGDPAAERPVLTRSQLPDIHQPLEILTDDIAPRAEDSAPASAAAPKARPEPARGAAPDERTSARKVFEAKYREPNPRLPFYITLGVLGMAGVGIVVYFWYQLRPPQMLVNPNPPASHVAAAPIPSAVPPASGTHPAGSASVSVPAGIPGLPTASTQSAPQRPSTPKASAPSASAPTIRPAARAPKLPAVAREPASTSIAAAPRAAPRAPAEAESRLSVSRATPQVPPSIEAAYAAFSAGNLDSARTGYESALREDPGNRDALLGLAAIEVRSGRAEAAQAIYTKLLRADPRDAYAHAALLGLHANRVDPLAAESRVKTLLAADPGAHILHFTLGNQLAQQARWPEAQQHYFKAYSADPDQPDFAYNLAVSLDQLRQHGLARQYYERAIALAGRRGAAFDVAAARERVKQLTE